MTDYDEEFPHIVGPFTEFEDAEEAEPGTDGLIETALIPMRDLVIYPNMVTPLFVGRERSLLAIDATQRQHTSLICAAQKDPDIELPDIGDLYEVGVEVVLGRTLRLPDGTTSALVQGRRRVQIVEVLSTEPLYRVRARRLDDSVDESHEIEALMRTVLTLFEKCVQLNRALPEDAYIFAMNIDEPGWLADLVATTLDLTTQERQDLLETFDPAERLMRISILLGKELEVLEIEDHIHARVQQEVDKTQRELFLREQMRVIQTELGESDVFHQEVTELLDRIAEAGLPVVARETADKEINRLSAMPPMTPEVSIIRSYLDWLLDLPWTEKTEDNLDVNHVAKILEADHYGLKDAKDRILEHIAVRKLAPDKMKQPILCFVGPPGTGKTSLGKSIARALGRKFVRVSLGGVRDEAEIRGHRRTYIGAMPGRIIQTMRRAGTINPLFMLDEIDKLGMDFRGDPSAALLEVLDPEQNNAFSDHYLEIDYDLSQVMFITTANFMSPIPPALMDRLELIEFPGYIEEEKLEIARRFLIPRELEQHGVAGLGIAFETVALRAIIREYTYEAGVRNLEREIAKIARKIARKVAEGSEHRKRITAHSVAEFLGPPQVPGPIISDKAEIGIAQGVAWTEVGGDVLSIEVLLMPGKGNLTLTGQLCDVMQESAQAALSYMRARADTFGIESEVFDNVDIHVHLPEGSIPKEGPSAGVTLTAALVSAFTRRPVRHDLVMTGEITLRGRVLPVGGVKEKLLAAYRVNITNALIPADNEKDLVELPASARDKMHITLVKHIDEVLERALLPAVEDPAEYLERFIRRDGQDEDTGGSDSV